MERKYGDDFGFEVITEGSFQDDGFTVSAIVIRLSCTAMNDWCLASIVSNRYTFKTREEWERHKAKKEKQLKAWERKILDKLKFEADTGYSITQSVGEIFTAVLFEEIWEEEGK